MIWCGRSWPANPAYRLRAKIQNWQSGPAHWRTGIWLRHSTGSPSLDR